MAGPSRAVHGIRHGAQNCSTRHLPKAARSTLGQHTPSARICELGAPALHCVIQLVPSSTTLRLYRAAICAPASAHTVLHLVACVLRAARPSPALLRCTALVVPAAGLHLVLVAGILLNQLHGPRSVAVLAMSTQCLRRCPGTYRTTWPPLHAILSRSLRCTRSAAIWVTLS